VPADARSEDTTRAVEDAVATAFNAATPAYQEAATWAWMEQLATDAARVRRQDARFEQLDRWMDLYDGKHFPETLPSYRPPVTVNELRTLILSEASDLSDMEPRIYIMKDPRHGGRDLEAERALRAWWARNHVMLKLVEGVVWAEICGHGFLRVTWDPFGFYGIGDVAVETLDPRVVIPDPDASDERRAQFIIYESVLDIAEIRKLFPHKGHLVKPEEAYSIREETANATVGRGAGYSPSYPYLGPMSEGGTSLLAGGYPGYKKARARVLDCYVRDGSLTTQIEPLRMSDGSLVRDTHGNPILEQQTKMQYPKGRRIVGANGVILYDGENTTPGGHFGLVRLVTEPTLGRFWGGKGFAQQTGELQLAADKLASAVVENAIRLNNGIVVVKGNTGLDWETFTSMPGQIVQINASSDFDIKYPHPMPPDMIEAPWRMLDMQRRILGFSDPRMGVGGRGNTSPDLTETEISQAQSTTRLRSKYLYAAVQYLAEQVFAHMAYGYTTPRVIPAVEGEAFKPVTWTPLDNPDKYAVFVDPASFQVLSRSLLRRMSLLLYRMGAIDRRAALEAIGWPDWEAVAGRIDEAERLSAMAKLEAKKKS
jgi:hypothetical protein